MDESFEIFLKKKRIDPVLFQKERPAEWEAYQKLFQQMGPLSFDHQKKFFFNPLRQEFPLNEPIEKPDSAEKKLSKKPRLLPKQSPQSNRSITNKKKGLPKLKPKLTPNPKKPILKPPMKTSEEESTE